MTATSTLTFTLGLILGSFFNVVIYRLPRGGSIITPPSHCPSCNTRLKVVDLIPIISFLLSGGKCRYCGEKISWQYPIVEALTGILFLLTYLKFGLSKETLIFLFLVSYLIIISFIDLHEQIIPNVLSYSGIIIGLILSIFFNHISFVDSLLGLLIPAGALLIIAIIFKGGMGIGDVKLVGMIGTFIGFKYTLIGIFLGAFIGSVVGIAKLVKGDIERKTPIPFGPFINIGALIMLFAGDEIINLYWELVFRYLV